MEGLERRLANLQDLLAIESFGGDDEARCDIRFELHTVYQEWKLRGQ
jgi:hypothetical protein